MDKIDRLLDRLTNMKKLAVPPETAEKSGCFSSYDRQSFYNEEEDKYYNWGANSDNAGVLREENEELVVLDLKEPGVVWRIWSAKPAQGKINFYFDN